MIFTNNPAKVLNCLTSIWPLLSIACTGSFLKDPVLLFKSFSLACKSSLRGPVARLRVWFKTPMSRPLPLGGRLHQTSIEVGRSGGRPEPILTRAVATQNVGLARELLHGVQLGHAPTQGSPR